jgi:hypothetical protein
VKPITLCWPTASYLSCIEALEDIMGLESEYVPDRTSRLSSLSPEDRRAYKKLFWRLAAFYTAAIVVMVGFLVVNHIGFRRAADVVVTSTVAR